jgi:hypothetical protein
MQRGAYCVVARQIGFWLHAAQAGLVDVLRWLTGESKSAFQSACASEWRCLTGLLAD